MWIHQITKPYLCPDNVDSSLYRDDNVDTLTYLMPGLANVDTSLYKVELAIQAMWIHVSIAMYPHSKDILL